MFPLLPFFMCDPLYIAFGVHRLWWLRFVTFFFPLATEEKKSLKRTFQQIQEEEDDDYPGSYSPQDPSAGPLLTEELIKALQDLENAASGDATVRQKIASLPQEVQDVSLLEKITGEKVEFRWKMREEAHISNAYL